MYLLIQQNCNYMPPRFVDAKLRFVSPSFDSPLTDIVIALDHLRKLRLVGDTPVAVFHQLKDIFHMLESLGSDRRQPHHAG